MVDVCSRYAWGVFTKTVAPPRLVLVCCPLSLCRPCPLTFTISCACGHTKHTLPCGSEAKAAPPRCPRACPVPALCRHAADHKPHRCHYGACPPCRASCGSALACGHICSSSSCHDPTPPAVADWQRPKPTKSSAQQAAAAAGGGGGGKGGFTAASGRSSPVDVPAAAAAAAAKEVLGLQPAGTPGAKSALAAGLSSSSSSAGVSTRNPCPPCEVLVTVDCVGHHLQQAFPCCKVRPFSCGQACGQPLACGNHTCSKPCHAVAPAAAGAGVVAATAGVRVGSSSGSKPEAGSVANGSHLAVAAEAEECEVCTRPCVRPRSCEHPCPSSCHPGPCEACQVARSCSCHCSKTTLQFPCCKYEAIAKYQQQLLEKQQQQKAGRSKMKPAAGKQQQQQQEEDPLTCGKPCHRELEFCRHPCRAACHLGACPAPEQCPEEVTVRCDCRRLKQKWPCWKVQEALVAAGKGRGYDGRVAPRLLACEAACGTGSGVGVGKERRSVLPSEGSQAVDGGGAADSKGNAVGSAVATVAATVAAKLGLKRIKPGKTESPASMAAAGAAAGGAAAAAAGNKAGAKKLSRAEREALAFEKEAERQRQQRRQQLKSWLLYLLVILLVGGIGGGLGFTVYKLLRTVDEKAQQVWRPDEI